MMVRGIKHDKPRRGTDGNATMTGEFADCRRIDADKSRRIGQRMIEMRDAHRLAIGVEYIVITVGKETVAAIITGRRDEDAALAHLLHDGDATPAWRAAGRAILQIHIDCRQRDDGNLGLGQ